MSVASCGLSDHETPRCNGRLLECRTYTIDEVATLLGIGRNAAYEGARRGAFPTIKIGKRLLVPKAALDRLLENGR